MASTTAGSTRLHVDPFLDGLDMSSLKVIAYPSPREIDANLLVVPLVRAKSEVLYLPLRY